jgi:hypothetical protein
MRLDPKERKKEQYISANKPDVTNLNVETPTFTTRELNPFAVNKSLNRRGAQSTDGRLVTYQTGDRPVGTNRFQGIGVADRDFQIRDSGVLRDVPEKYQTTWKSKDLEAIGYNPKMWKGAKTTGILYQDGKEYPLLNKTESFSSYREFNPAGTTGNQKYSGSHRKLTHDGKTAGRTLRSKSKHIK